MNAKALFGRYIPGSSVVHSLDPRTKLLGVFAMVVVLFLARDWAAMAFCAVAICAFFLLARIPIVQAVRSVVPILFVAVLAALFNVLFVHGGDVLVDWGWLLITTEGLYLGAFVGARLVLLLLLGSLLTMTTTTMDITDATEKLLSPLGRIGVPVHEFAFVMGTALRFVPQFAEEFETVRLAQTARGARLATSPIRGIASLASLVVPMFASVFRHADTLSAAMDARCYAGEKGRTRLHPLRFSAKDVGAAIVLVAAGIIVWLL